MSIRCFLWRRNAVHRFALPWKWQIIEPVCIHSILALHFATKETSFIYTAIMLIFLAIIFVRDVTQKEWNIPRKRDVFILLTWECFYSSL
jgi:hypothetical protein